MITDYEFIIFKNIVIMQLVLQPHTLQILASNLGLEMFLK
jgi:hypothetical protein